MYELFLRSGRGVVRASHICCLLQVYKLFLSDGRQNCSFNGFQREVVVWVHDLVHCGLVHLEAQMYQAKRTTVHLMYHIIIPVHCSLLTAQLPTACTLIVLLLNCSLLTRLSARCLLPN